MKNQSIAVVVPTMVGRKEVYETFLKNWNIVFELHNVTLFKVLDGNHPTVEVFKYGNGNNRKSAGIFGVQEVMDTYADLIHNHNDGVRNLGFALAYIQGYDIIVSLDDDVAPHGDTIRDHLNALSSHAPARWINTVEDIYMRGFPYAERIRRPVAFSHGLWHGVYDFDGQTQVQFPQGEPTPEPSHRKMAIPHGVLFPCCVMNVAFKREILLHYYQAPMIRGINRFADIWSGIVMKRACDAEGWGVVSGYATVHHDRASDAMTNLKKEAIGMGINENFERGAYHSFYLEQIKRWQEFLRKSVIPEQHAA